MSLSRRRLLGGGAFLTMAVLIGLSSATPLALALGGLGFAIGWALIRVSLRRENSQPRTPSNRLMTAALLTGAAISTAATGVLAVLSPVGPQLFACAMLSFVAGWIWSLRFSRVRNESVAI